MTQKFVDSKRLVAGRGYGRTGAARPADRPAGGASSPVRNPSVTVVVPCRNEEAALPSCLRSIHEQAFRDLEILVVDGGSDDASREIVAEWAGRDPRIRLLDNPRGIVPAALNVALDEAVGTWLVRIDAHSEVPPDYVARLVALLETGVGGAGGRKQGRGTTPTGRAIALAMASKAGVGGSAYHHATRLQNVDHIPFGAYPVWLAREVGGWRETLPVNQDFEFDVRVRKAGYPLVLDPSIVIDWESRQTLRALFRQYRRYGRGKVRVMRLHPRSIRPRQLAAPCLVAAIALLGLPVRTAWVGPARRLLAGSYAAVITVAAVRDGRELPLPQRPRVAASLVAMHLAWGCGFWSGVADLVRGRTTNPIVDRDRLNGRSGTKRR